MLRRSELPEPQRTRLSRIVESADRMTQMVADLLDFTRGRLAGGLSIAPAPTDLGRTCREGIEEIRAGYPQRRIRFVQGGDASGEWDAGRLAQVVSNLLTNAVQHSPADTPVDVRLRSEGESVVLEVRNQGDPIPPEALRHLFDPFYRGAERAETGASGGLGLGLYIVQQIVLAHGGTLTVRSSASEATTFAVALPRHPRPPAQPVG